MYKTASERADDLQILTNRKDSEIKSLKEQLERQINALNVQRQIGQDYKEKWDDERAVRVQLVNRACHNCQMRFNRCLSDRGMD